MSSIESDYQVRCGRVDGTFELRWHSDLLRETEQIIAARVAFVETHTPLTIGTRIKMNRWPYEGTIAEYKVFEDGDNYYYLSDTCDPTSICRPTEIVEVIKDSSK